MAVAPPFILMVRCHYCSQQRWPSEIIYMPKGMGCCLRCYEWNAHAIKMLSAGAPPPGCQECGITFAELERRSPGGNTSMMLHRKDDIYQILCRRCSDAYFPKRRDLYGQTIFGHERGLR
jgi:hypothetical protein